MIVNNRNTYTKVKLNYKAIQKLTCRNRITLTKMFVHISRMCSLDEVPFKVALDSVEIQLGLKEPVTAPELKIPDCIQILRDTKVSI